MKFTWGSLSLLRTLRFLFDTRKIWKHKMSLRVQSNMKVEVTKSYDSKIMKGYIRFVCTSQHWSKIQICTKSQIHLSLCFFFSTLVSELREYCHLDTFNASCPHGSVIMMQSARYGRMRIGRCLKTSYYIGCRADVLPHMDRICSGKRSCVIKTVDSELLKYHPCRKDLMPYLEAQFKCITSKYQLYCQSIVIK